VKPQFRKYVPDYVTAVPPTPRLALKAQAQAAVWVLNYTYRKHLGVFKGSNNFYIQTWHGDRGLKTIGYLTGEGSKNDIDGHNMSDCDLFIAASDYGVRKARQGLRYEGEVMVEGMPRNDKLVNISNYGSEADKVRKAIGIDNDVKIVLYAPTFRDEERTLQCAIDINQTLKNLEANGDKWICLIRSHSLTKKISTGSDSSEYLDVSSYPDMADLLLIADLLLTDYSSCAGDFLLTEKPVVLVHFDKDEYLSKARSLWINPEEAGYLVAKNQTELNSILSHLYTYDNKAIANKINQFYGTKELGKSSEAVAARIIQELK
jgi:CDP-glycerol glycerophosphotransferase